MAHGESSESPNTENDAGGEEKPFRLKQGEPHPQAGENHDDPQRVRGMTRRLHQPPGKEKTAPERRGTHVKGQATAGDAQVRPLRAADPALLMNHRSNVQVRYLPCGQRFLHGFVEVRRRHVEVVYQEMPPRNNVSFVHRCDSSRDVVLRSRVVPQRGSVLRGRGAVNPSTVGDDAGQHTASRPPPCTARYS